MTWHRIDICINPIFRVATDLPSPAGTSWLVATAECCQGTNKSLVTNQEKDVIQEGLAAIWLCVPRGCEQAWPMCYSCRSRVTLNNLLLTLSLNKTDWHISWMPVENSKIPVLNVILQRKEDRFLPLVWRRSISLVRQSMSICSNLFLHRNCFISSIWQRRTPEAQSLSSDTRHKDIKLLRAEQIYDRVKEQSGSTLQRWLASVNNTKPKSYWAQQQQRINLPQPISSSANSGKNSWLDQKPGALHLNQRGFIKLTAVNLRPRWNGADIKY